MIAFVTEILDTVHHLSLKLQVLEDGSTQSSRRMGGQRTYCDGPVTNRFFPFPVHPKMRHIHPPKCSGFHLAKDNEQCPKLEPWQILYPGYNRQEIQ
jgi:hypothetical protein